RGVGRALLRRLVDAGFNDREALCAAGREAVAATLKNKTAMAALWAVVESVAEEPRASAALPRSQVGATDADPAAPGDPADQPPEPLLVVDLRARRVTYRGHQIPTK